MASTPWTAEQQRNAEQTDIVTFGSPSAVKSWVAKVKHHKPMAVCIGPTTTAAAVACGFPTWQSSHQRESSAAMDAQAAVTRMQQWAEDIVGAMKSLNN